MKFRYTSTLTPDTQGRLVKRPVLKLELTTASGRKIYPIGLVDSGADLTLVNIQYAKELGIDVRTLDLLIKVQRDLASPQSPVFRLGPGEVAQSAHNHEVLMVVCKVSPKSIGQYVVRFEQSKDMLDDDPFTAVAFVENPVCLRERMEFG